MTRQPRTLYHARINYVWHKHSPYSANISESDSYDMNDTLDRMMAETRRFPRDHGYVCNFDANTLSYTVSKFDSPFATITIHSSDDGIDL